VPDEEAGELLMILAVHRQGLMVAVITRQDGIERGVKVPTYGPRPRDRLLALLWQIVWRVTGPASAVRAWFFRRPVETVNDGLSDGW
jgi:hypothetical protein